MQAISRAEPDEGAKPFLKWAGGKWSLAPELVKLLPCDVEERVYREPFVGGGAMYFYLQRHAPPKKSFLSDALADLIVTYEAVRSKTDALVAKLARLRAAHSDEMFYRVRDEFNARRDAGDVDRAAWLIYLNTTCFNGLFRTNRDGVFNVPVGRFKNPAILDEPRLRAAARALAPADIRHRPFDHLAKAARPGDVVYFDPPYVPLSRTANFAAYADGAFGLADQARLADLFRALDERGCLLALSNSDTPDVRRLYEGFDVERIVAHRRISSKADERKPVGEVLVRNLDRWPASARPRRRPAASERRPRE
jgi:DNA adenine methylase